MLSATRAGSSEAPESVSWNANPEPNGLRCARLAPQNVWISVVTPWRKCHDATANGRDRVGRSRAARPYFRSRRPTFRVGPATPRGGDAVAIRTRTTRFLDAAIQFVLPRVRASRAAATTFRITEVFDDISLLDCSLGAVPPCCGVRHIACHLGDPHPAGRARVAPHQARFARRTR